MGWVSGRTDQHLHFERLNKFVPKVAWVKAVCVRSHLGARLRGRMATQRSKKRSDKVLGKGCWEGFLGRGPAMGFTAQRGSEKGSQKGF